MIGLVSAEMIGRKHVLDHAKRRGISIKPIEAEAFAEEDLTRFLPTEAIDFFRNSLKLPMKTVEKIVERAGTRSKAARDELVKQLREFIDGEILDALRNGTTLDTFTSNVQGMLEKAGLGPANPFRLETIFRTNMKTATTAGRLEQMRHPDVRDEFQWLQYNAVMDGATRPDHAAMNGRVYHIDDPIWKTWMPPNGFNCRCSITPVSRYDIEDEGLSVSRSAPKIRGNAAVPDRGFRRNNAVALKRNPKTGMN